jgi:broad specificity phosphatase PhoE
VIGASDRCLGGPRDGRAVRPDERRARARFDPSRRDALATLAGAAALLAGPTDAAAALPPAVLAALREGGCVLLLRHARTDPGVGDPPGFRLDACGTQRNLSAEGRAQAERLGATLREAGVAIGPVRSSRWCRCLDTARLAFGRAEPWPALDSFFDERSDAGARTDAVRRWALGVRGPDNVALVTHQVNVTALLGGWIEMGETIVLRPGGDALATIGRFGPGG